MTIYVYDGRGTCDYYVNKTLEALDKQTEHHVDRISSIELASEQANWKEHCACLVIPGGRTTPYRKELNGAASKQIRSYVENKGKAFGICAGAYYFSRDSEFEKGRENGICTYGEGLSFYKGLARGTVLEERFNYEEFKSARWLKVMVDGNEEEVRYHGGPFFSGDDNAEVLASYKAEGDDFKEEARGAPAIVKCKVGDGVALLSGPHLEVEAGRVMKVALKHLELLGEEAKSSCAI